MAASAPTESPELLAEREARLCLTLDANGLGERFHQVRLEKIPAWLPDEYRATAARLLRLISAPGFIALGGPTGVGKTALAGGLMRAFVERGRYARKYDLAELFGEFQSRKWGEQTANLIEQLRRRDLLVLDEVEPQRSRWIDPQVRAIVNYRYERPAHLTTIIITNRQPEALVEFIGEKTWRRLDQSGGYIACDWESIEELARRNL